MAGLDLNKKLWRIPQRGMVKGVCAGIAQHLDVPVKLVRLITVLAMIFGLFFFVLVAYIILTFALDAICWPPWMPNWPPVNSVCVKWSGM